MAYDLEQAGELCFCPECGIKFVIPGGTKEAIQNALVSERKAQANQLTEFEKIQRSKAEWQLEQAGRETAYWRGTQESSEFERFVLWIVVILLVFLGLTVTGLFFTGKLEEWFSKPEPKEGSSIFFLSNDPAMPLLRVATNRFLQTDKVGEQKNNRYEGQYDLRQVYDFCWDRLRQNIAVSKEGKIQCAQVEEIEQGFRGSDILSHAGEA